MSSKTPLHPRVQRRKTVDQQATVDEILQVVADQGRRYSLSQADYTAQKRLAFVSTRQRRLTSDSSYCDDSASSCTSSSDLSNSPPPPTRQSGISSLSDDGRVFEWSSAPRSLPPLNRVKAQRLPRPPPLETNFDERQTNCSKNHSRPMSARGQRSQPRQHRGLTI